MNKFMSSIGLVCLLLGVANAQIISKNGIAKDSVTGLEWQDDSDTATVKKDWVGAKQYCEDLRLDGKNDWRLPNIYELSTLIDNTKSETPYVVDGLEHIPYYAYWSSSPSTVRTEHTYFAWLVGFYYGEGSYNSQENSLYVRCVRGEEFNFDILSRLKENRQIKLNEKIFSQLSSLAISMEKNMYEAIKSQNSIIAYKEYLQKYPNGQYALTVKSNINKLQNQLKDKMMYESANSRNTIFAYKDYLKEFPNGEYVSSARSNIQYLESEAQFRSLLQSKSPQQMYLEAGKQERSGNKSKATKLYEAIVDRFPTSDFAVRASDKLTGASRAENEASNRRSQSRQECENNKNACLAGCGTYISGADSHNSAVWSCNDKCKQISCY